MTARSMGTKIANARARGNKHGRRRKTATNIVREQLSAFDSCKQAIALHSGTHGACMNYVGR